MKLKDPHIRLCKKCLPKDIAINNINGVLVKELGDSIAYYFYSDLQCDYSDKTSLIHCFVLKNRTLRRTSLM